METRIGPFVGTGRLRVGKCNDGVASTQKDEGKGHHFCRTIQRKGPNYDQHRKEGFLDEEAFQLIL